MREPYGEATSDRHCGGAGRLLLVRNKLAITPWGHREGEESDPLYQSKQVTTSHRDQPTPVTHPWPC
ncbi:hypothetical protein O3P69_001028 [Scylla paramamosain]|uniref:Uncharacterized protein n=1 Tax=Scylla paramamosain TaxID=85552 RepID=A0AAW0UQW9_SCYPA